MGNELRIGGTFVLNCVWNTPEKFEKTIPNALLRNLAKKKAKVYVIDANALATEVGLGKRTNTIMQTIFFSLCGLFSPEKGVQIMIDDIEKT